MVPSVYGHDAGFVLLQLLVHSALLTVVSKLKQPEHVGICDYFWLWLIKFSRLAFVIAENLDQEVDDDVVVPAELLGQSWNVLLKDLLSI